MAAFEVTGSHIKRLEGEGPQPVAAYAKEDIDGRGFLNTGDFLQSLSFNSGTTNSIGVPAANPVSNVPFARGAVAVNPRGLGATRFLVLLDGKRPSSYGLPDNRGGAVFDFNSLPTEAIERIDFLKDGASAIYGTDAIAGVMNIKLRRNFSGLSTSMMYGNTSGHDTGTRNLSVLMGDATAKGSYLLNLNWFKQNANFAQDYDRSKSTDYSTAFGSVKGQNNNSTSNFPFNFTLTAAQATQAGLTSGAAFYGVTGGTPWPTRPAPASPGLAPARAMSRSPTATATSSRRSLSSRPGRKTSRPCSVPPAKSPTWCAAQVQVLVNKNRTGIVYTPISIDSRAITNADGSFLTVPAANPFNPLGFAIDNFRGRGNFGPARTFNVETNGVTHDCRS
jgi:outer membrane receptor protein involved in Fe transport